MRFFFRSRQFKIIISVFLALVIISAIFGILGKSMAPGADVLGTVTAPFRSLATSISNVFSDFSKTISDGNELMLENAELKEELNKLREQMADFEKIERENEELKEFIELKEQNPDFEFASANLISRDNDDLFGSFLINRGTLSGVAVYDPVITAEGLVGFVTEVGLTTAKVTTVLNPDLTVGALDNRTGDSGIVSGKVNLSEEGLCRFYNLARSCNVAIGDYVITSGEGIFPEGLLIGSVTAIGSDEYNTSVYADIEPFVDFENIRGVMVITDFEGQGGISPKGEDK
ncbi:MAG: rod shape-determining protein MreC [Clostridia bacterium]|nr:rod shape-determining protein MreC [Clostridia bacterium]